MHGHLQIDDIAVSGSQTNNDCPGKAVPRNPRNGFMRHFGCWEMAAIHDRQAIAIHRGGCLRNNGCTTDVSRRAPPCIRGRFSPELVRLVLSYSAVTETGNSGLAVAAACTDGRSPTATSDKSPTSSRTIAPMCTVRHAPARTTRRSRPAQGRAFQPQARHHADQLDLTKRSITASSTTPLTPSLVENMERALLFAPLEKGGV